MSEIKVRAQKPFPNFRLGSYISCDSLNILNMWYKNNMVLDKITNTPLNKLEIFDDLMMKNGIYNEFVGIVFAVESDIRLRTLLNTYKGTRIFSNINKSDSFDKNSKYYACMNLRSLLDFMYDIKQLKLTDYYNEFLREMTFVVSCQTGSQDLFKNIVDNYKVNFINEVSGVKLPIYIVDHILASGYRIIINKSELANAKSADDEITTDINDLDKIVFLTNRLCPLTSSNKVISWYRKFYDITIPPCHLRYCDYIEYNKLVSDDKKCPVYLNKGKEDTDLNIMLNNYLKKRG